MLVTDRAKMIRMPLESLRVIGRGSAGVRLFDVADGEHVVGAAKIDEEEAPENPAEEMVAEELSEAAATPDAGETPGESDDGAAPDDSDA